MSDWVEILRVPHKPARLGTLLRVGVALGWKPDDLGVTTYFDSTILLGRKAASHPRPTLIIKASPPVELDVVPEVDDAREEDEPPPAVEPEPEPAAAKSRTCRLCPRVFDSWQAAELHADKDHVSPKAIACPDCGALYVTTRGFSRHRSSVHGDAELPNGFGNTTGGRGPRILLACSEGDDFTTSIPADLFRHAAEAHGRPPTDAERTPVQSAEAS